MILHGLPTCCSSSRTVPIRVQTTVCSSCKTDCATMSTCPQATVWKSAPLKVHYELQGDSLLHHVSFHSVQNFCSLEHLLHWPWCMQGYFSDIFSLLPSCCCAVFFPFLKCRGATRVTHWLTSRSWLELAHLTYPHRDHLCSPSNTKTLPCKPSTTQQTNSRQHN